MSVFNLVAGLVMARSGPDSHCSPFLRSRHGRACICGTDPRCEHKASFLGWRCCTCEPVCVVDLGLETTALRVGGWVWHGMGGV